MSFACRTRPRITSIARRRERGDAVGTDRASRGELRRPHPEGGEARRHAHRAVEQVRARHQPANGEGARPYDAAVAAPACGPDHRIVISGARRHPPPMSFLAFLLAASVLALTPGPGIAYVVARTVAGGRAEGLASCFGTALGGMLHVAAAATGLSLLVAQSATAFTVVK